MTNMTKLGLQSSAQAVQSITHAIHPATKAPCPRLVLYCISLTYSTSRVYIFVMAFYTEILPFMVLAFSLDCALKLSVFHFD